MAGTSRSLRCRNGYSGDRTLALQDRRNNKHGNGIFRSSKASCSSQFLGQFKYSDQFEK